MSKLMAICREIANSMPPLYADSILPCVYVHLYDYVSSFISINC